MIYILITILAITIIAYFYYKTNILSSNDRDNSASNFTFKIKSE